MSFLSLATNINHGIYSEAVIANRVACTLALTAIVPEWGRR